MLHRAWFVRACSVNLGTAMVAQIGPGSQQDAHVRRGPGAKLECMLGLPD